jgi:hypothetical protein
VKGSFLGIAVVLTKEIREFSEDFTEAFRTIKLNRDITVYRENNSK